jgi:heat shock protein HslJ
LKQLAALILVLGVVLPVYANDPTLRYRGQYHFGHEVNTFCPEINSQCYWLSPETTRQRRQQLKQLVNENSTRAYETVCVVVEGRINRDPVAKQVIGFAADYDGLFTVSKIYGLCGKSGLVTQGDLQHHRWILESINGKKIEAATLDDRIPELEIGEQMMVSGYSGCNRFHGKAALRKDQFSIYPLASTRMYCKAEQNDTESMILKILGLESTISIDTDRNLILQTDDTLLQFRLEDRVG